MGEVYVSRSGEQLDEGNVCVDEVRVTRSGDENDRVVGESGEVVGCEVGEGDISDLREMVVKEDGYTNTNGVEINVAGEWHNTVDRCVLVGLVGEAEKNKSKPAGSSEASDVGVVSERRNEGVKVLHVGAKRDHKSGKGEKGKGGGGILRLARGKVGKKKKESLVKKTCEQKRKFIEIGKGLIFTKGGVVDKFAKPSNKQRSEVTLQQSSIKSYFANKY